ncbi:MAG: ORF6N domain-containing protein [Verrucomicrobia bacterium]|nr:MAG: ORF6N domain-containing protein [Verrucomicrobiota bacterium]
MNELMKRDGVAGKIFLIRGVQVMLDSDLAELYGVTVKRLNEQVKRNVERFPEEFRFQLTKEEPENLRSHFATSSLVSQSVIPLRSQNATLSGVHGGRRYLPYVFTEQGVAMLSAVLRSDVAVKVSVQIMKAFVEMRHFVQENALLLREINQIKTDQVSLRIETDKKFEQVFNALEAGKEPPKQGVFFDGQIFDAYAFVSKLVRKAKTSMVLVDNYVDDSVLTLLSKRRKGVTAKIYCKRITKQLQLDLEKHNAQYEPIKLLPFNEAHDRFLILDGETVYHIGASLKDLGKKWFAFSKIEKDALKIMDRLPK